MRHAFETLKQNGIADVALPRIGDPSVIPLWFGESDQVTPEFIRDAAKDALDRGITFYTHPAGRPDLRHAIKRKLDALHGIDLDPGRIVVPGATMLCITMAAQMTVSAGDHALIVSPNWPNIDRVFHLTGCRHDFVRQKLGPAGWSLDLDGLFAATRPDTRAIFVNTPCNPTGWVMTAEEQQELLAFCRARGIVIIADEVYHRNIFDGDVAPSFLAIARPDDPVIVVNGFSKSYAMTGWRLGWMVGPSGYERQSAAHSECVATGAPVMLQVAGIAALEKGEEFIRETREHYRRNRQAVMEILGAHPRIALTEPEGAFYAFPRVDGLQCSMAFAQGLLAEEHVGLAPGATFGPGNEDHIRLCFAQSHGRLNTALHRIVSYLDRLERTSGPDRAVR